MRPFKYHAPQYLLEAARKRKRDLEENRKQTHTEETDDHHDFVEEDEIDTDFEMREVEEKETSKPLVGLGAQLS